MRKNHHTSRRGGYRNVLLPFLLIVALATSCQQTPSGIIIANPSQTLRPLSDEEVKDSLNIPGIISELDNPPIGMNVIWSAPDDTPTVTASETASPEKRIIATITFDGYRGRGIAYNSGINEIRSGIIILAFTGTYTAGTGSTTAMLQDFTISFPSLTMIQERGTKENSYSLTASGIKGTATEAITLTYSTVTNENTIEKPTVAAPEASSVTIDQNSVSITVSGTSASLWSGNADTSWYDADSTSFSIYSAEELAGLASIVNAGTDEFEGKTIELRNDIDLAGIEWTPIGGKYTGDKGFYNEPDNVLLGFRGTFNGNGHSISNLRITRTTENSNYISYPNSCLGLFGVLENGSSVGNLTIENVSIVGDCFIGSLAAYIPSAPVGAEQKGVSVSNVRITGEIELVGKFSVGGLLGRVESNMTTLRMENCMVEADAGSSIIAPAGLNQFPYENYNGGLIGAAYSSQLNSFRNCSVSGLTISTDQTAIGGFAGLLNPSGTFEFENCSISDCRLEIQADGQNLPKRARPGAFIGILSRNPTVETPLNISSSNSISNVTLEYPSVENMDGVACKGLIGCILNSYSADPENVSVDDFDTSGITYIFAE